MNSLEQLLRRAQLTDAQLADRADRLADDIIRLGRVADLPKYAEALAQTALDLAEALRAREN